MFYNKAVYIKKGYKQMKPNFDPVIEECIKEARANLYMVRTSRQQEYMPYCDRLFAYAASEQSDYLFAQAYYCMMLYYACVNDYINTVSCAMEGIKYQQNTQEYELVARSYNMLGIFTASTGNGSQAVDYYLSSIDYCNQYHFDHVHAMAASNLADVFHRSLVYNRALYYYEEAEKYFMKNVQSEEKEAGPYYYLAQIAMLKGEEEKAVNYINLAIQMDYEIYEKIIKDPIFFAIKARIQPNLEKTKLEAKMNEKEKKAREHLKNTYILVGRLNNNDIKMMENMRKVSKEKDQRELN